MGLLQNLPKPEQFTSILSPVLGDETAGTGVAGVLKLLKGIDTDGISSSLSADLGQTISSNFSLDSSALTGGALEQFQQVMTSFPNNPASLIEPLTSRLDSIKNISSGDLSTQLLSGINGLQSIETLIPTNTRDLISDAAESLSQLKGEFISGSFGELKKWSESVRTLYTEIAPLVTGGTGTFEERLIEFLRTKITDLITILLPAGQGPISAIATQFGAAISADSLTDINTVKTDLISSMNAVRVEFDRGNFSNTAHFAEAQAKFQQLTTALADITSKMRPVIEQEVTTPAGLTGLLQKQIDDFKEIEVIDLGNIKDKFTRAIKNVEEAIEGLNLESVSEAIEDVFTRINEEIGRFDLSQLTEKLSDLRKQLDSVLEALDAALFEAIASIRNIFTTIKEALRSVASALGSYDENGDFHYHIQQDIENFLNSVKTTLRETIEPMLDQFKNTIGKTLRQVQDALDKVKGEIEAVKAQLQSALQGVNEQLQNLDVARTMENIRQKLDSMLGELGVIDFNSVVDPVVSEIKEMGDGLKKIDVSSLNEIAIGALKISVEVVTHVDFSAKITNVLMTEIDKLLEAPRGALNEIEEKVEGALQKFGELEPDALLAPLDEVFAPITERLDALKLDSLLGPLDAWYESAQQDLDRVTPAALLQPLIDLHTQLLGAFDSISLTELIRPLQASIDDVKGRIQAIDITGVADELGGAIDRVRSLLDEISPERLLDPLVNAFDKIMTALDQFEPGALLKPLADVFDAITAPLDNLNADHVHLIGEVFAGLRDLPNSFDPQHAFQALQEKFVEVRDLLQQLNVGGLISELKNPYEAMRSSFETGGGSANVSLSTSVDGLNPLRNDTISQAVTDIQQFQTQLGSFAQEGPPTALINSYNEIKSKLESFIPSWARENISPASIRRAFQLANPLDITAEVNRLYETIKQQLRNFDPRVIQENVKDTFETVKKTIFSIDPAAIVGEVQGAIDALTQRLDTIDLQLIADELEGLVDEIETIINGLDPHPIIAQLQGLVDEVKSLFDTLKPSEVLSELNEPFEAAKEIVAEFDPASFKEPLQEVFENIQTVIKDVDVGVVLQPIVDRLDKLRDELEKGLKRTETSFNGMIRAIPV